ncbi:MAG: type II toxin-antitoxin system RelE/ParE family toxin [Proteobacteria bacterium]|nr:type II toxin-antitoxin system RelE/ParE family toxin [Pseudomonadota bacterium]
MYELSIYQDAEEDLERLLVSDESLALELIVYLEELRDDMEMLDAMRRNQRIEGRTHVSILWRWPDPINLWRLKLAEIRPRDGTFPYRIIYAPDPARNIFHVLAIMHRDQDYERDKALRQRLLNAYEDLGLPKRGANPN